MFCRVCPAFASADVLKVKKLWESVADGSMERRMDIAWLSVMWLRRVCRCIALWWTFHIVFKRHGHMNHCNPLWYCRPDSRDLWRYLFNTVGTCWHLSKCPSLPHSGPQLDVVVDFWHLMDLHPGCMRSTGHLKCPSKTWTGISSWSTYHHVPNRNLHLWMSSDWLEAHIIVKYCQDRRSRKIPWPIDYMYWKYVLYIIYLYMLLYLQILVWDGLGMFAREKAPPMTCPGVVFNSWHWGKFRLPWPALCCCFLAYIGINMDRFDQWW